MTHRPDPVEDIVEKALTRAGVRFVRHQLECPECHQLFEPTVSNCPRHGLVLFQPQSQLDFYLPDLDTYIECKQFYTGWITLQMQKKPNIILIQGLTAAKAFASMLNPDDPLKLSRIG